MHKPKHYQVPFPTNALGAVLCCYTEPVVNQIFVFFGIELDVHLLSSLLRHPSSWSAGVVATLFFLWPLWDHRVNNLNVAADDCNGFSALADKLRHHKLHSLTKHTHDRKTQVDTFASQIADVR